jgi:hypothetical protein
MKSIGRIVTGVLILIGVCGRCEASSEQCGPENPLACRPSLKELADTGKPIFSNSLKIMSSPGSYCFSAGGSTLYESISSVTTLKDKSQLIIAVDVYIANPTGCSAGYPCPEYDTSPEYVHVWIDFDGDGVYESQEKVMDEAGTGYLNLNYHGYMTFIKSVVIPAGAVPKTYLRVNLGWGENPENPCQAYWTWGNVYDKEVTLGDVKVTELDIRDNVAIRDYANPVWKKVFDTSGNLVDVSPPENDPIADDMTSGKFTFDVTVDAFPSKPQFSPTVKCNYVIKSATNTVTGNPPPPFTGWTGTLSLTTPQNVGVYDVSLNFNIFDPDGNQISSQPITLKKMFIILNTPNKSLDLPVKEIWLEKATAWAAGANDGKTVKESLVNGIYGSSGWIYTPDIKSWQQLVEGKPNQSADCQSFSSTWDALCKILGVPGTGVKKTSGDHNKGFVTKPATALDGKTGNAHPAGGANDRWYFAMHQVGTGGGSYYDPTMGSIHSGLNDFIAWHGLGDFYPDPHSTPPGRARQDLTNPHFVYFVSGTPPWGSFEYHSPVLAVTSSTGNQAHFVGPHTDEKVDNNHDGYADQLVIHTKVEILDEGGYTVVGALYAGTTFITSRPDDSSVLPTHVYIPPQTGIVDVQLAFSGEAIFKSGLNGPYTFRLYVVDDTGVVTDQLDTPSAPYSFVEFGELPAYILAAADNATDKNGDGQPDTLDVAATLQVVRAGEYTLEGVLNDATGTTQIAAAAQKGPLAKGSDVVTLSFAGDQINKSMIDGPYHLELRLYDDAVVQVATYDGLTKPYHAADFSRKDFLFTGEFHDRGMDTDGNGLYNYLAIDTKVQVFKPGQYILQAWLQDTAGKDIVFTTRTLDLLLGQQSVVLLFDGAEINAHGVNGPYSLIYILARDDKGIVDSERKVYQTQFYNSSDFEKLEDSLLARVTGNFQDYGNDLNGNSRFDELVVNVEVVAKEPGNVVVDAKLRSPDGMYLGTSTNYINLPSSTPGWVKLAFDGKQIFASGKNGPYLLTDLRAYHTGDPSKSEMLEDVYKTHSYAAGDFEPVASIRGRVTRDAGQPFAGCVVSADGQSVYTNEHGEYFMGFAQAGTKTVSIDPPAGMDDGPWSFQVNGTPAGEGQSVQVLVPALTAVEVNVALKSAAGETENVVDHLTLSRDEVRFSRQTGQSSLNVSVKNVSSQTIGAPLWLVISDITDSQVSLVGADGLTSDGKPYIDLTPLLGDGRLAPGERIDQRIYFDNPARKRFDFSQSVYGVLLP